MADVFISYKKEERERMRPVAEGLAALRVGVWFDAQLQAGKSFAEEIREELSSCRAQIVLWSKASVVSEWVRGEADIGRQRKILIPVLVEECDLLPPFNMLHAESLVGWNGELTHPGWVGIARRLGSLLDRPGLASLCTLLDSQDPNQLKGWLLAHPTDAAHNDIAARLQLLDPEATQDSLPSNSTATAPEIAPKKLSLVELQSAAEAAEFRLRVYRDAARRFKWQSSDEERRLENEVKVLRLAVAEASGIASTPEMVSQPKEDEAKQPKKSKAPGCAWAVVGLIIAVVIIASSMSWYAPISTDSTSAPAEHTEPSPEQRLIGSLGGPGTSAAVQLYAGDFEAVGLDPQWAFQLTGTTVTFGYRDGSVHTMPNMYGSVREHGVRVSTGTQRPEFLFVIRHEPCTLMNGVTTEFRAFVIDNGAIHEGCAMRGVAAWPLADGGSTRWHLSSLFGTDSQ